MMTMSRAGLARLKAYEAFSGVVYDDEAGLPTIGYGHLIRPGEHFTALSEEQAEALLAKDLTPFERTVAHYVTATITQDQFDSLVSLCFNIGERNFLSSTVLRRVNQGATGDEVRAAFLMWDKIHKDGQLVESPGLRARREKEAQAWRMTT